MTHFLICNSSRRKRKLLTKSRNGKALCKLLTLGSAKRNRFARSLNALQLTSLRTKWRNKSGLKNKVPSKTRTNNLNMETSRQTTRRTIKASSHQMQSNSIQHSLRRLKRWPKAGSRCSEGTGFLQAIMCGCKDCKIVLRVFELSMRVHILTLSMSPKLSRQRLSSHLQSQGLLLSLVMFKPSKPSNQDLWAVQFRILLPQ